MEHAKTHLADSLARVTLDTKVKHATYLYSAVTVPVNTEPVVMSSRGTPVPVIRGTRERTVIQLQHAGTTRASTDRVQTNQGATCVGARRGTQGKTAKQQNHASLILVGMADVSAEEVHSSVNVTLVIQDKNATKC